MAPDELKAHNAQQARTIERIRLERGKERQRADMAEARAEILQGMVDWLNKRIVTLEDKKAYAERYFND